MAEQANVGYVIVSNIVVAEQEFVLGYNKHAVQKWVTWEYSARAGYFWGHYFDYEFEAVADLLDRASKALQAVMYGENDQAV